jgi:esterase/lipase
VDRIGSEASMQNQTDQISFDVFYLHGFCSSPSSVKAVRFKNMLNEIGVSVEVPDLNVPSFKEMTLSKQIELVENQIDQIPGDSAIVFIGSSMGGLLASLLSERIKRVKALVLLAPGFGIARRWKEFLNQEEYDNWKNSGEHSFYHHAHDAFMPLGYAFAQDLERMKTEDIRVDLPCLVFHGVNDTTVPIEESKRFAGLNQSVDLRVLDDDHQLLNSLDLMLSESLQFLRRHELLRS